MVRNVGIFFTAIACFVCVGIAMYGLSKQEARAAQPLQPVVLEYTTKTHIGDFHLLRSVCFKGVQYFGWADVRSGLTPVLKKEDGTFTTC